MSERRKLSTQEKVMIGIVIMLLTGIFLRREYIKKEGGDAFRRLFSTEAAE